MSGFDPISYAGVLDIIVPSKPVGQLDEADVSDDLAGEQEATSDPDKPEEADLDAPAHFLELLTTLNDVSRGVSDGTHIEYSRLIEQCKGFLTQKKLVGPGDPEFFSDRPHKYAPQCDELNLDGTKRPSNEVRATYGTAQKMRASMTYAFGRLHGLGSRDWHCSEGGSMVGNPSVSEMVSRYMLSLHRRKDTLKKLYDFNRRPENWDLKDYTPGTKKKDGDQWGGPRARRLLQLAFTLAFSCLLRVDEVLKIQSHDFVLLDPHTLVLTLPFRKTSQFGDIKPFVLHEMPDSMAYLCPVQAYAEWLEASEIESGYVFRRLGSGDRVSENNQPMVRFDFSRAGLTAECFLEMFRNNLIDIGVDPAPYGTHSFRRVKYLISWNDDPTQKREDFFNFNRAPALKCFACGRTCHCS
ncbi:hypothetical protein EDB84DRAFT_1658745 [Lactarius hengduanensis]|nr:hypothetical protein EDB84DRAFT_1658745 [Lactarius hengduanensis]